MTVQLKDFRIATAESMWDIPEIDVSFKALITSAPGEHIAAVNQSMLKNVVVQVLKSAVLVEPADAKPAAAKKEEVKDGKQESK